MPDFPSDSLDPTQQEVQRELQKEAEFEAELEELLRTEPPAHSSALPSDYPIDLLLSDWSDDLFDL